MNLMKTRCKPRLSEKKLLTLDNEYCTPAQIRATDRGATGEQNRCFGRGAVGNWDSAFLLQSQDTPKCFSVHPGAS